MEQELTFEPARLGVRWNDTQRRDVSSVLPDNFVEEIVFVGGRVGSPNARGPVPRAGDDVLAGLSRQ